VNLKNNAVLEFSYSACRMLNYMACRLARGGAKHLEAGTDEQ